MLSPVLHRDTTPAANSSGVRDKLRVDDETCHAPHVFTVRFCVVVAAKGRKALAVSVPTMGGQLEKPECVEFLVSFHTNGSRSARRDL